MFYFNDRLTGVKKELISTRPPPAPPLPFRFLGIVRVLILVADVADDRPLVRANGRMAARRSPQSLRDLLHKPGELFPKDLGGDRLQLLCDDRQGKARRELEQNMDMVRLDVCFDQTATEVVKYLADDLFRTGTDVFSHQHLPIVLAMEDQMVVKLIHLLLENLGLRLFR